MHSKAKTINLHHVFVLVSMVLSIVIMTFQFPRVASASSVNPWWPTSNAHVSGVQPFKADLSGVSVDQYQMYWQVDGGALVAMDSNYTGYPHKEASVDVTSWVWHGVGPYVVTFVAKQNGGVVAQQSVSIYNDAYTAQPTILVAPAVTPTPPAPAPVVQSTSTPAPAPVSVTAASAVVQSWWPTANASISGVQPFKAVVSGMDAYSYAMYWQVDGGTLNSMNTDNTGYPHKEASVDVSKWNWNASGMYTITFVAKNSSGAVIGQTSVPVKVLAVTPSVAGAPATTAVSTTVTQTPTVNVPTNKNDPLSGMTFWVNPHSSAAAQASAWSTSDPTDAQLMRVLAAQSTANWFGGWNSNVQNDVHSIVASAQSAGSVPVLVAYNIPFRDCGGYSAGGATTASAYNSWIQSFASGIGNGTAIVILEPDSLATISCLSSSDAQARLALLSSAVNTLKANPNTKVYIDAGHSGWVDHAQMANLLRSANVSRADGFALNVSNFGWTSDNTAYGTQVSSDLGGTHFVIDTSRNGLGPTSDNQWCNPSGRATGTHPTASTGNTLIDAFLWLKVPGESDGSCNGGPGAGTWWPSYAVGLAQRAQ